MVDSRRDRFKLIEKKEPQFTLSQNPALITYAQAVVLVPYNQLFIEASDFYWGDQWRKGDSWIGPRLDSNDDDANDVLDEIRRSYVTSSALEEVTDRRKDALLGRPGTWEITLRRTIEGDQTPTAEEQSLIDEANAALVEWYDDREVLKALDLAQLDLQLGKRGLIRLIVPEGELIVSDDGTTVFPANKTFRECLRALWPVHAPVDQGMVLRDSMTMRDVGIFIYRVTDILSGKPVDIAEVSYVDDTGNTVINAVGQMEGTKPGTNKTFAFGSSATLQLAGKLPIHQMRASKPMITESLLSNQKALNMSLTMMGMNVVLAGFLERVILNGQRPGDWVDPVTKEVVPANAPGAIFVPLPYKTGPKTTQWIQPSQLGIDPTTKAPLFGKPDIKWRDPVAVDTFIKTQDGYYRNILQASHQLHVIISGDAVASGESRKQARDDYEKMLKKDKVRLDQMGQWLLETALCWASVLEGRPGRFSGLRVVYNTKVDAGPIAAIDRTAMKEEVVANLRSRDNYMVEARVTDDPESETERIVEEQQATDPIQQIVARRAAAQLLLTQASTVNPNQNNPANPGGNNPGGGTGGGGSGVGSQVRRGSGRSKPTIKP